MSRARSMRVRRSISSSWAVRRSAARIRSSARTVAISTRASNGWQQVRIRAVAQAERLGVGVGVRRRQVQDADVLGLRVPAQPLRDLEAHDVGQVHVEHDELGPLGARELAAPARRSSASSTSKPAAVRVRVTA